ncbi:hypothetical protein [Microbulbifer aestuariivivens]|uniref:hypothetical protein n=1 Tax=Microbulbifer aestuariivivens TaxID=1908308 RepID=UPI0031E6E284
MDYWFSLIPFVDERFFQFEGVDLEEARYEIVDGGVRLTKIQSRLRQLMQWTFNPHPAVADHPYKEVILEYLAGFADRMDSLPEYPGELKQLWESVKSEYAR